MYNIEEFDEQKTKIFYSKKEQNKKLEISFLKLYQKSY